MTRCARCRLNFVDAPGLCPPCSRLPDVDQLLALLDAAIAAEGEAP